MIGPSFGILLLLVSFLLAGITQAAAQSPAGASRRHWGVGWDRGLGFRYRTDGQWGFGLRVNPDLYHNTSDRDGSSEGQQIDDRTSTSTSSDDDIQDTDVDRYGASAMAFREFRIGRWVGVGPFAEISFDRTVRTSVRSRRAIDRDDPDVTDTDDTVTRFDVTDERDETDARTWAFSIGLRPTFTIEERFALETRFGVSVAHSDEESTRLYRRQTVNDDVGTSRDGVSTSEQITDSASQTWQLDAIGRSLGLGAEMEFMIYF